MGIKQNLSKNLKAFRAARGLSMTGFASELGISKSTLQSIMASGNTTLDTAERIAASLGVPQVELLFDDRLPQKSNAARWLLQGTAWYASLSRDAQTEVAECIHRIMEVVKCGK